MNKGAPHQNGRLIRLLRDENGGEWYQNNSAIVNRACDKWLRSRGLITDKYNANYGKIDRLRWITSHSIESTEETANTKTNPQDHEQ